MGRGAGEFQKSLSARVPYWVYDSLVKDCEQQGIKMSDYLRNLLTEVALKIKED